VQELVVCSSCGRAHPKFETELGFHRPDPVNGLSELERNERCRFSSDAYVLDEKRFFVRGVLPLPVVGRSAPYNLGVWAELSKEAFGRIYDLWTDPAQASEPPFAATLANSIPLGVKGVGLMVRIQLTGPTTRPTFTVVESQHPLYLEQARGIDEHRALEYSECASSGSAV
jgi:hypothetical protein